VHKILLLVVSVWLGATVLSVKADSLTLTDGNVLSGDVIKFDESGLMLRQPGEVYTNVPWMLLSQGSLKQLSENPKIKPIIEPLLEPEVTARAPTPVVNVHEVVRLKTPRQTSVLGGLFSSSVGIFIGLLLYAANLYAGFEISICRNRPTVMVVLISGILPIIAPIIFLAMPTYYEGEEEVAPPVEESAPTPLPTPGRAAPPAGSAPTAEQPDPQKQETQQATSTWTTEQPKKQQTQVFQRGKFMFNKRFIETKFGTFMKGANKDSVLVIITPKGQFVVNRVGEVTASEMQVFCDTGEALVAFADIHEAQIKPRTA
jgi:hypothetical protein